MIQLNSQTVDGAAYFVPKKLLNNQTMSFKQPLFISMIDRGEHD